MKPNILFIFTDEQKQKTMRVYGNDRIRTPNLDKLSKESIVFNNSYVTQPICTPSRSSIMTGLFPHTTGCIKNNMVLNENIPTIAEILKDSDYELGYFGKWHLGNEEIPQHGFEKYWISIEEMYKDTYTKESYKSTRASYHEFLVRNGLKPDRELEGYPIFSRKYTASLPEEYSKPAFLAKEASEFIKKNKDKNFVLYVGFLEPHMPFFGPFDGMYKPEDVILPKNFDIPPDNNSPLKYRWLREFYKRYGFPDRNGENDLLQSEDDWRNLIARYWGLVSLVDKYVGKILQTVEECNISDNTVVVFTSDHGDMMGSHQLVAKSVMYEEAVKVPLLIKIPWLNKSQKIIEHPVSQIDLVPTILDILGHSLPPHLQGKSLYPFLRGNKPLDQEAIFIEWNGEDAEYWNVWNKDIFPISEKEIERVRGAKMRTVITQDGWKLNISEAGENELYNLNEDPLEANNLFYERRYPNLVRNLFEKIKKWQRETNDEAILDL